MKKLTTMTAVAALLCSNALSVKAATLTNWARGGIATQSTTYPGGDANKAIDGNTSGWWTEGFITHTADSENTVDARPWWQVDLQANRSIAHLHIWFRDDCCQPRNENLRIVIYDSADVATRKVVWESDTTQWANQVPREIGFDLNPPVTGRVIYVDHIPGLAVETHNFVSLAEVEAFDQPLIALDNYARDARGGVATSSSCYLSDCVLYGPEQSIDGNLHGATSIGGWPWAYSAPDNSTDGGTPPVPLDPLPWWQVDLAAPQSVGSIVLWPRRDRTFNRFHNIKLTLANASSGVLYQQTFSILPSGPKFVVNLVPAIANAKSLKIETTDATPDKFLNLPEVQVFAPLASAPAITFTTDLQPVTVSEGVRVTLGPVAVTVDGGIRPEDISYRWFRNGVEIPNMAGSWLSSFTTPNLVGAADNGAKYKVQASVSGHGVFSSEVTLTVNLDTTAPVLQYANGDPAFNKVRVWFSESLNTASAQDKNNYQMSGGVTVLSATQVAPIGSAGDNMVDLVTSAQTPGQVYTVTVNNVKDISEAGNPVAPNSSVQFTAWTLASGFLGFEHYDNLGGAANTDIDTALADPRVVAGNPTTRSLITGEFNTRSAFPDDTHENYLVRITGWLTPTESGDYDFFLRADDAARLYLSTTEAIPDPATATPIAIETDCCDAFQEPGTLNDDAFTSPTTETPIQLTAGRRYGVLALLKEAGGGDWLMVAWRKSTDSTAAGSLPNLPGQFLSTYIDPNAEMSFTQQPTDQPGSLPSTGIQVYSQNFDTSDGGFTVVDTTDKVPPNPWIWDGATGKWVTEGSTSGCDGPYNSQLISPAYKLTQDGMLSLSFSHRYSFEGGLWDAGMIGITVNGGGLILVPADNFSANGYAPGNIIGSGIALGQRGFNADSPGYAAGEFITSTVTLGTFKKNDTVAVHFIGAWDDCSSGTAPNWVIDSMKLDLLPMIIQDFATNDGGFTVINSATPPPAGFAPFVYNATAGQWTTDGSHPDCGGPFNSRLTSPAYVVPTTDEVTLNFAHRYSFEGDLYDGGAIYISVNGGAYTPVSPDGFTANGYAVGNIVGNGVLKDKRAFNGDSPGYASGTLITSSVVLGTLNQNDTISVQFVAGFDDCWGPATKPSWLVKSLSLAFGKAPTASTFEAEATASRQGTSVPVTYQWQRNDGAGFVNIAAATFTTLRIFPTPADFLATFRVVASIAGKSITSNVVRLTEGDTTEPEISVTATGSTVTIEFTGRLQSSVTVKGTYSDVSGATSPYSIPNPTGTAFFRAVK